MARAAYEFLQGKPFPLTVARNDRGGLLAKIKIPASDGCCFSAINLIVGHDGNINIMLSPTPRALHEMGFTHLHTVAQKAIAVGHTIPAFQSKFDSWHPNYEEAIEGVHVVVCFGDPIQKVIEDEPRYKAGMRELDIPAQAITMFSHLIEAIEAGLLERTKEEQKAIIIRISGIEYPTFQRQLEGTA